MAFARLTTSVEALVNNFSAYHSTKSFLSSDSNTSMEVINESGSFFPLVEAISWIVTWNPIAIAILPVRMALIKPAPNPLPPFTSSVSGMILTLVVRRLITSNCFSVQDEPKGAMTFATPILWSRITSGAPSTRFISSAFLASFNA